MPKTATKKKVLVAEDEKPMAHALQLKLQREGFDVDVAPDGEAAMAMLTKGTYDALILDLVMPKMNGFEVLEGIQELTTKPKVIVASNLSQEQDAQRAKGLGADDYFVKSNTPLKDIVEKVKQHLNL
jgi:two-component system, OmpR family, response regulator